MRCLPLTTYWIAASGSSPSPGLHALIEDIRLLELELNCTLQVIHVPGLLMIDQGTNGLSCGIWMSPLHGLQDAASLTCSVFEPLCFDPGLVQSYLDWLGLPHRYNHCFWKSLWDARRCFDTLTVWSPPLRLLGRSLFLCLRPGLRSP
jgi:hypothetical protein